MNYKGTACRTRTGIKGEEAGGTSPPASRRTEREPYSNNISTKF